MDLLYFVLLVSVLIFIHESGHFAFAKIFGVKVLTFSIGFGPKILKIRGKETEYCLGILPFGGFVKMLEESKRTEPLLPEDKKRTFESQALWKRVVIVLAGPAMNLLFPIVLYTSVYLEDQDAHPPMVGAIRPGQAAEGKLKVGDRILSIDGTNVSSFPEVQQIVSKSAGKPLSFAVQRDGKNVDVTLVPDDETVETKELELAEHIGQIGVEPTFNAAVLGVARPGSPASAAQLQTFDRITAINGKKVDRFIDVVNLLAQNRGETAHIAFLRPMVAPNALGGLCAIAVMEPKRAELTPLPRPKDAPAAYPDDADGRARDVLDRTGIESAEMYAGYVPEGSGEWKAGLRPGDRIQSLDGVPQRNWKVMTDVLERGASDWHELVWTRLGAESKGRFQIRKEQWEDDLGQSYESYIFRTDHWNPKVGDQLVPNPSPFTYALRRGVEETGNAVRFISVGFVRLIQGKISLSSVSGPITMYDIAGRAGAKGTTTFLWAMAILSVNLGLLNLLPIPVLDGGHLFFFLVEAARRKPLSLRVREVASLVGMVLLFALMLVAFKNDVERRWDVIVAEVREIFT